MDYWFFFNVKEIVFEGIISKFVVSFCNISVFQFIESCCHFLRSIGLILRTIVAS